MGRKELNALIAKGPVRIRMNDGEVSTIESSEFVTVSDIAAAVLYHADDGKLRHLHLPLVTMSGVESLAENA